MKTLNRNINRISVQPPRIATQQQRQQAEFQQEIVDNRSIVKLCSCPKSLFDLWQEYTVGIGGGKPAKEYTKRERSQQNKLLQEEEFLGCDIQAYECWIFSLCGHRSCV
jgi:hypothetical protein